MSDNKTMKQVFRWEPGSGDNGHYIIYYNGTGNSAHYCLGYADFRSGAWTVAPCGDE